MQRALDRCRALAAPRRWPRSRRAGSTPSDPRRTGRRRARWTCGASRARAWADVGGMADVGAASRSAVPDPADLDGRAWSPSAAGPPASSAAPTSRDQRPRERPTSTASASATVAERIRSTNGCVDAARPDARRRRPGPRVARRRASTDAATAAPWRVADRSQPQVAVIYPRPWPPPTSRCPRHDRLGASRPERAAAGARPRSDWPRPCARQPGVLAALRTARVEAALAPACSPCSRPAGRHAALLAVAAARRRPMQPADGRRSTTDSSTSATPATASSSTWPSRRRRSTCSPTWPARSTTASGRGRRRVRRSSGRSASRRAPAPPLLVRGLGRGRRGPAAGDLVAGRQLVGRDRRTSASTDDGRRADRAGEAEPFMLTPLVIAMPEPMAEALGYPETPIGYADILALRPGPGRAGPPTATPSGARSGSARPTPTSRPAACRRSIAQTYAATGKTEDLTARGPRPARASIDFATRRRVGRRALRRHHAHLPQQPVPQRPAGHLAHLRLGRRRRGEVGHRLQPRQPRRRRSSPARSPARRASRSSPSTRRRARSSRDNPFFVLDADWVDDARGARAPSASSEFVQQPENQEQVLEFGFRPGNPDVAVGEPDRARPTASTPTSPRPLLEVPEPAVLIELLERWEEQRKPARVLLRDRRLRLDGRGRRPDDRRRPSSTWPSRPPSTPSTSSTTTTRSACGSSPPTSATRTTPRAVPRPRPDRADRRRAREPQTKRARPRSRPTARRSTRATQDGLRARRSTATTPTRINAVVLLTDGVNDDGEPDDDRDQLDELLVGPRRPGRGPASRRPVRVFTIAYGDRRRPGHAAAASPRPANAAALRLERPTLDQQGLHRRRQQLLSRNVRGTWPEAVAPRPVLHAAGRPGDDVAPRHPRRSAPAPPSAILAGGGIIGAVVLGGAGVGRPGGRRHPARRRRTTRIDPFTLSEPWRRFVTDALQAQRPVPRGGAVGARGAAARPAARDRAARRHGRRGGAGGSPGAGTTSSTLGAGSTRTPSGASSPRPRPTPTSPGRPARRWSGRWSRSARSSPPPSGSSG